MQLSNTSSSRTSISINNNISLLNNLLITITFFIIYLDSITLILFNIAFKFIFILLSLFYKSIIISFTSLYLISIGCGRIRGGD